MVTRRRCSECGGGYTPSPRAGSRQRVCGPECRASRDRKLARGRRRRDVDAYRADERVRQRASRDSRAKARAAASGAPCHGPPSAPKSSELPEEVVRFLDRAFEASRASMLHDLRREWLRLRESVAKGEGVSRASFGDQVPASAARSGPDLARRHA
jgi:hypothetical protein